MKIEFNARKREAQGTGASRRLRRTGRIPGIVYGGDRGPVNIELDHKEIFQHLSNEAFHASILTLKLEGAAEPVLLRAFNMHPWKGRVQHVDFQRVSKDNKIHMKVPLHFINAEKSPGVKEQGGVANHVLNELDISCLPDDLPEFIEVDMGELSIGRSIHVKELKLPGGVEPVLHSGENPVVATVILPVLITEEEEAAAAETVPAPGEVPTTEQAQLEAAADAAAASGTACSVVGTSPAAGMVSAAAASSSSVISTGRMTVHTTGSSPRCRTASTPLGSFNSLTWIDLPMSRCPMSTSMNPGRSSGKQVMSSSLMTWLATPPCSFTPGETSALMKCSGTFMWIFLSLETRWKSTCCTRPCQGCMLKARSSTSSAAPSSFSVRIEAWNASFDRCWWISLWSSTMLTGPRSPP